MTCVKITVSWIVTPCYLAGVLYSLGTDVGSIASWLRTAFHAPETEATDDEAGRSHPNIANLKMRGYESPNLHKSSWSA